MNIICCPFHFKIFIGSSELRSNNSEGSGGSGSEGLGTSDNLDGSIFLNLGAFVPLELDGRGGISCALLLLITFEYTDFHSLGIASDFHVAW